MVHDLRIAARTLLKTAMFRHSADRRFRELFRQFQFRAVARDQAKSSKSGNDGPTILPFCRGAQKPRRFTVDGQIFRMDGAEPLSGPSRRAPSRRKQTP